MNKNELMYQKLYNESVRPEKEKRYQWQLRAGIEKQKQEQEHEAVKTERKVQDKAKLNKILFQQIQERVQQKIQGKQNVLEQERNSLEFIRQGMNDENLDKQKLSVEAQRKAQYLGELQKQMQDNARRKGEVIQMSELERKLNAKDLEAYEKGLPVVHSRFLSMPKNNKTLINIVPPPKENGTCSAKDSPSEKIDSLLKQAGNFALRTYTNEKLDKMVDSGEKTETRNHDGRMKQWNSCSAMKL